MSTTTSSTPSQGAISFPTPVAAPSFAGFQHFSTAASTYTHTLASSPAQTTTGLGHLGKSKSHFWVLISVLGDCTAAIMAGVVAFWIRFNTSLHELGVVSDLTLREYAGYILLGSVSLVAVMAWQGIYQRSVLLRPRWIRARMAKGIVIWTLSFLMVTLTFQFNPPISRIYTFTVGACTLLSLLSWRVVLEMFLHRPQTLASLQQRTIIVGWNEDAERLVKDFNGDALSAFNVVGWVEAGGDQSTLGPRASRLGSVEQMEEILFKHHADVVIAADLTGPRDQIVQLTNLCEREMIDFKIIPSCFRIFVSGLHLETMAGTPMIGVDRLPLDNTFNVVFKRLIDIVGASIGLILFAPVMAVFAALVYFESPGAVVYRQRRSGLGGRTFSILKIRSMKLDAEVGGKVGWSTKNDPRRLRIGAFMRKWNIDELPQFWNVIKGEMSLVGPRPERPELIKNFKHEIPHYNARHHAKPGITGWAQIKGLRGDTDLGERIKCDLWYLENWTPVLDLQIMALTFFKRQGAC